MRGSMVHSSKKSGVMFGILLFTALVTGHVRANAGGTGWSYDTDAALGPSKWETEYPDCGGVMQSPINLPTKEILYDPHLKHFDLSDYTKSDGLSLTLVNKGGHTAELIYSGEPLYITEGNLPDKYKLDQIHFHWGSENRRGSEHTVDDDVFPMELHMVHHQTHLNSSIAPAHPYGLAVIGVFFQIGEHNDKFDVLVDKLKDISDPDSEVEVSPFPLAQLLPKVEKLDYYRYMGSLTTPPCYETVIWSLSLEPITISNDQLQKFRSLHDNLNHPLVDDFRPIQSRNQRTITTTSDLYATSNSVPGPALALVPLLMSLILSLQC